MKKIICALVILLTATHSTHSMWQRAAQFGKTAWKHTKTADKKRAVQFGKAIIVTKVVTSLAFLVNPLLKICAEDRLQYLQDQKELDEKIENIQFPERKYLREKLEVNRRINEDFEYFNTFRKKSSRISVYLKDRQSLSNRIESEKKSIRQLSFLPLDDYKAEIQGEILRLKKEGCEEECKAVESFFKRDADYYESLKDRIASHKYMISEHLLELNALDDEERVNEIAYVNDRFFAPCAIEIDRLDQEWRNYSGIDEKNKAKQIAAKISPLIDQKERLNRKDDQIRDIFTDHHF